MIVEALGAFRSVVEVDPAALFVFAGQEADEGMARQKRGAWAWPNRSASSVASPPPTTPT